MGKDAEAAARFYAETFPDSAVGAVHRAPSDYPSGKEGDVLTVEFRRPLSRPQRRSRVQT
jgi:predicted 3-demethylubiquinone-9 3-methyltransferase (glyoxalase superfamily)